MINPVIGWVGGKPRLRSLTHEERAALIQQLTHRKSRIRWMAADLLGKQQVRESVDALMTAVCDPHWLVRLHAAKALGRIGDSRAFTALRNALQDTHISVRRRAVVALGELHDEQAIYHLLQAVQRDKRLWGEVASSLTNFVNARAAYTLVRAATAQEHEHLLRIPVPIKEHITPFLITLLVNISHPFQYGIIELVGQVGDQRAIPQLNLFLYSSSPKLQQLAYIAIGRIQYRQYEHLIPDMDTA